MSPVVFFKGIAFWGIFINLLLNTEYFAYEVGGIGLDVLIGFIGFLFLLGTDLVGLLIKPMKIHSLNREQINKAYHKLARIIFCMLFIGSWIWRWYAASHGLMYGTHLATLMELKSYSNLLGTFNFMGSISLWGLFVFMGKSRYLIILLLTEIIWLAVSGSKSSLAFVLLSFFYIQFWRGGFQVTDKVVVLGMVASFVFIGSFACIHAYRVDSQRQIISGGYESFSPIKVIQGIELESVSYSEQARSVVDRMNLAWRFSYIIKAVELDDLNLWFGKSLLRMVYWVVPRALWEEKPNVSLGHWFARRHLDWESNSRSEAGITVWGEGYLNFGIIGSIFLPLVWVAFLQYFYTFCIRKGNLAVVLYASVQGTILNSLAANVAMPFAFILQYSILIISIHLAIKSAQFILAMGERGLSGINDTALLR